jgi:hypothetical protein
MVAEPEAATLGTRERFLRVALLGCGAMLLGALSFGPGSSGHGLLRDALVLAPLVPLLVGLREVRRHGRADGWLLFGVPASLALGQPYAPARVDPIFFCTWAAVLVAYLVQAARLLAAAPRAGVTVRRGRAAEGAVRLRHRARTYDALLALCVIAFALLVERALTTGGAPLPAMATAGLLAILACRAFLLDPLDRHLQRDPALEQSLARLRRHARRGRPSRTFYAVAAAALVAMTLFVLRERLP